jgi:tRNA dimethylallyltransferase
MEIGTAKPSEKELLAVSHHFINTLSVTQEYDVKQYEQDALQVIDELFVDNSIVILTGGSGMYIKAVTEGFDEMPGADPEVRERLNEILQKKGIGILQEQLKEADPEFYGKVDLKNPQRIIRALEVFMVSGRPFSSFRTGNSTERNFKTIKIGLERERAALYERIDQRMDAMKAEGLFEEAERLFSYRHHNALQTVG